MRRNSKKAYLIHNSHSSNLRLRRPFWLSSLNYYFLSLGISIASFFISWGILHSVEEEMPWITAGIFAGLILIFAVGLREVILKKKYNSQLIAKKRLDYNIKSVYKQTTRRSNSDRLTLERIEGILKEIENRSKTAKSIAKLPSLHLEVFEMCHEYLRKSGRELEGIFKESPRYEAIRRGQKKIQKLHRFHLLSWASIESQTYLQTAKVQVALNDKIENSQRALSVLDTAIQFYPDDEKLVSSTQAVKEFIVSIKVSHWLEEAERASFKGNYQSAIDNYLDTLFFLEREEGKTKDTDLLSEKINFRIEDLRKKLVKNK